MLVNSLSELFLPIPLYLLILLSILCVRAFRYRNTRLRRLRYWFVALVVWSYLFSTPAVANVLINRIESQYPTVNEPTAAADPLIVVLSSGVMVKGKEGHYEVRLDPAGWERTYAGIRLWRRIGGQLLFVGGPSPDRRSSVAAFMADIAIASSVPSSAVHIEAKSRNTRENFLFNRDLVAGHGDNVWLVTSAIHMRRAMGVADALGLHVSPYPCGYRAVSHHWYAWLPNSGGPALFSEPLHELIGLAYYQLRGRAK